LSVKQKVLPVVDLCDPNSEIPENRLRFVCFSDTHSRIGRATFDVPHGDVLLHAGDFTNTGRAKEVELFGDWLEQQPFKHKIVIAGNHDLTFEVDRYHSHHARRFHGGGPPEDAAAIKAAFVKRCTYLEDDEVTIEGIRIYGSPWQPEFCDWAFNLDRGEPCLEKWKKIPEGIDVLLTHGPPVGFGDLCENGLRAGCVDLLFQIQQRIKPKFHVAG
jgi:hypothetical protein